METEPIITHDEVRRVGDYIVATWPGSPIPDPFLVSLYRACVRNRVDAARLVEAVETLADGGEKFRPNVGTIMDRVRVTRQTSAAVPLRPALPAPAEPEPEARLDALRAALARLTAAERPRTSVERPGTGWVGGSWVSPAAAMWRAVLAGTEPVDYWRAHIIDIVRDLAARFPDDREYASENGMVRWCMALDPYCGHAELTSAEVRKVLDRGDRPDIRTVVANITSRLALYA